MKSLELIVTGVLILHILNPSDGILQPSRELFNVLSKLEYLQKSDDPCGSPEVLISMLKGNESVKPSQLGMMLASMDRITDMTDPPDLNSVFGFHDQNIKRNIMSEQRAARYWEWKSQLQVYLSTINALYDRFTTLRKDEGPINVDNWMALATDIENTMRSNLTAFRAELLNGRNVAIGRTVLNDFIQSRDNSLDFSCEAIFALNGFFNQLLNLVFTTQMKAMVPQIFATLLRDCSGTVWRDNLNRLAIEYKDGYLEIVRGLEKKLDYIRNDMLPCDPFSFEPIKDPTKYELEDSEHISLIQFWDPEGHKSCSDVRKNEEMRFMSMSDECRGNLYDCDYVKLRERYRLEKLLKWQKWITASHVKYGDTSKDCLSFMSNHYIRERDPTISHCLCKCNENLNHISVTPVMTDRSADMVVTGFRFVLENRVLYVQAKQGKLLPGERIDPASVEWIPLPKNPKVVPLNSQNGKFHIGDVMADMNEVPVGISFVQSNNSFYLQMYTTSYVFNRGISGTSIREVPPPHRDDPEKYVEFQLSNRAHKKGQPVLPLIDARIAEAKSPALVRGLGIAYDHQNGGKFSPKIIGLDYADIFQKIENRTLCI
ncbi:uncharacterized protein LOC135171462 [Diachasmimorpha longicaudata]|uniref:uncharacterized protein LOC135171462 n=1 Tax=Diachasmimorpha longicaudata TaxID=58733 RepID=UPI0030B89F67